MDTRNRISLSSQAGEADSPFAWLGALALHSVLIAAVIFTFSYAGKIDIVDNTPSVPVDLVTLSAKNNVMAMVKEKPKAPPKDVPAPPPPDKMQTPSPTPPAQPKAAELAPPKPADTAKAETLPSPQAKPQPPKPDKQKSQDQQLDALLNKLAAPPTAAPKNAKVGNRTVTGVGDMNAMTADLKAMLQGEIGRCWSPPVGAPHPERLVVTFELFLNRDGSVAQAPQLAANSAAAARGDVYMQAAVEQARRAIYTCAPYKLPADRYDQWRDIEFAFNPAIMVGGGQ